MASLAHTYGPSCLLHEESNEFTRKASVISVDPPSIKAQFFYSSALPIDDPLSPVPPPPSGSATRTSKLPPQPFSIHDSHALEKAWLGVQNPGRTLRSLEKTVQSAKVTGRSLKELKEHKDLNKVAKSVNEHGTKPLKGRAAGSETKDGFESGKATTKPIQDSVAEAQAMSHKGGDARAELIGETLTIEAMARRKPLNKHSKDTKELGRITKLLRNASNDRPAKSQKGGKPATEPSSDTAPIEEAETPTSTNKPDKEPARFAQSNKDFFSDWASKTSKGEDTKFEPTSDTARTLQHTRETSSAEPEPVQQGHKSRGVDLTLCDDPDHIPFDETMPVEAEELGNDEFEVGVKKKRGRSPFRHRAKAEKQGSKDDKTKSEKAKDGKDKDTSAAYRRLSESTQKAHNAQLGSSPSNRDTTGTPFLRVPSRLRRRRSRSSENKSEIGQADGAPLDSDSNLLRSRPVFQRFHSGRSETEDSAKPQEHGHGDFWNKRKKVQDVKVTVGVSRLHVVEMPSLKMGPIYWDPVHDISSVVRGTWFYKETMWPVEAELANRIEEGYEYIKPWTPSYVDELNSCQEIGAEAELKVVHEIWPADEPAQNSSRPPTGKGKKSLLDTTTSMLNPEEQERKHAIVVARNPENRAAGVLDGFDDANRLFAKSSIIYANGRDAQILQPSQLPSVARGRRPLAKIRKGQPVGIPVVRGFDYKAWEKIYPPKKGASTRKPDTFEAARTAAGLTAERPETCSACLLAGEKPRPTDLVFMIHGIGQKLSERVESFHFTHAINAFRRQINLELESEAVQPWKREGLGEIMVLPINWRSKMKLEDGGSVPNPNQKEPDPSKNQYELKDITAESLPAVRNLISDVMLDIPYYLSHHKPKMVEAVIKEANRIYRLWCNNNPGFHESGRVHLVAHSLGSVMALDILSKQPTKLPKPLDFRTTKVRGDILEFDTKSLFFCGSPAGFFLLLNRAPLLPRKGRDKPDVDGEDLSNGVAGEVGTYGCLSIDNLYNISHEYDPIAYRVNACVDKDLSASLQQAIIPSVSATWAQYFGSVFKAKPPVPVKTPTGLDALPSRPMTAKMPSTVELETHNFTKEEVAEKRMNLLNDNGQIDFTLKSGGGPLEIQYLNMLSAHSSYWTRQDFIRFLVVEIARPPGRSQVLANLKAVKKTRK